jgi:oxygen-independent coproporphyrinogen III oxidase
MGVSSISALEDVYAQNWRDLPHYYEAVSGGSWPTMRGIRVRDEDKLRRSVINRILCHAALVKSEIESDFGIDFDEHFSTELARLCEMEKDGLVSMDDRHLEVTPLGRIFVRNVAMVFDEYLSRSESSPKHMYSKTL